MLYEFFGDYIVNGSFQGLIIVVCGTHMDLTNHQPEMDTMRYIWHFFLGTLGDIPSEFTVKLKRCSDAKAEKVLDGGNLISIGWSGHKHSDG